jgi:hypothetical protein
MLDLQGCLSALLTPGTPQLTAILGAMVLYLALHLLRRPAAADADPRAAAPSSSQQTKQAGAIKRPLGTSDRAVAAHRTFVRRPTVSICCQALFPETAEQAVSQGVTLTDEVLETLQEAVHVSKVYLLLHDTSADGLLQAVVQSALEGAGVLGGPPPSVPRHRFLCCDTTVGKVAIVRQLEAAQHVESDEEVHSELSRFGTAQWLITAARGKGSFLDFSAAS